MKPDTKLHIAHSTGKRNQETCDKLFQKLCLRCKEPTRGEKATFISDGNEEYTNAISKYYLTETVNYGQLIKIRDESGHVIRKEKRVVFGEVDWIETVYVERYRNIPGIQQSHQKTKTTKGENTSNGRRINKSQMGMEGIIEIQGYPKYILGHYLFS